MHQCVCSVSPWRLHIPFVNQPEIWPCIFTLHNCCRSAVISSYRVTSISSCSPTQIAFHEADLARVVRDSGDIEKSAKLMQQALDLYRSTIDESTHIGYSERHPKYASMLAVMGLIQRDLGKLREAKELLEQALRIQETILSQQNLMKAETIRNLGTVLHRLGDRSRALESLNSALSMMKSVKYEHPITATTSAAIAQLLLDMGDIHSAQAALDEALKIRTKCCGGIHPNVALYHRQLGEMMLGKVCIE